MDTEPMPSQSSSWLFDRAVAALEASGWTRGARAEVRRRVREHAAMVRSQGKVTR